MTRPIQRRKSQVQKKRSAAVQSKKVSSSQKNISISSSSSSDEEEIEMNPKLLKKLKTIMSQKVENESSLDESSDDDDNSEEEEESVDEESDESNDTPTNMKEQRGKKEATANNDSTSNSEDEEDGDSEEDRVHDDDSPSSKRGFTDENSSWLRPTKNDEKKLDLLEDSSNDEEVYMEEDVEEDDDDLLEIERQSKLLDAEMKLEEEEAEQDFQQSVIANSRTFHLPTLEDLQEEQDGTKVVPPSELKERIEQILFILGEFKTRREPHRSRSDYIQVLTHDISQLYGYLPELVEYFLTMFNPAEAAEFISASDDTRPLVIRTNTLKVRRKDLAKNLMKRGVTLDPLASWSKVGLKIVDSTVPIGATPEYLSGQYMLQSAASFCPVLALNPSSDGKEIVLDMSSAPGGKTSYLAQLMKNTGILYANDLKPERQKATVANLHRLGVKNVITCCYDGRVLGKTWKNRFTKILLDAPCSGLGVISRDPSVKIQRTIKDVERCAVLQKELILNAIDALKFKKCGVVDSKSDKNGGGSGGGVLVYSTCSVSVAENEEVVNYLLQKRDVKLLDTGLDFGKPGFTRYQQKRFHPSLSLTRRFYPHVHNMDGFFVARIQKLSDKLPSHENDEQTDINKEDEEELEEGIDTANKHIDEVKESNKKNDKKRKMTATSKGQKRKKKADSNRRGGVDGKEDEVYVNNVQKKQSIPPRNTQKKKATNSKVTKPRRQKKHAQET